MHPILFHIPLPHRALPYSWLVLAAIVLSILFALYSWFVQHEKGSAIGGAVAALLFIGVRLGLRGVLRSTLGTESEAWDMGPIPIYSYGVMLGLSLVVGWYLTLGLAKRDGLPPETMANNYVVTAVVAVLGSRVLYILTNLSEFDSFASMFAMRRGGLVAYGGFLGGLAGSYFFLRRHRIPLLPWADVAVPSLASGLMITRIGCYLFGCDFGQPLKDSAPELLKKLGTFPHWAAGTLEHGDGSPAFVQHVHDRGLSPSALASLPVHPTQLYESAVGLGLLLLLLWARKKQQFRGQIFFLFAFAYGVCRYLLEILRDDKERGSIPPELPEHILIPLGLAVLSIGWVIGFSKVIENKTFQRLTQILAFVPVLALYLLMKPDTFASAATNQLSTSQFIAISSGFAASIAFAVFHKAALAHPRQAMALGLPADQAPEGSVPAPDADQDDEDDEEERQPVKRPVAKKGKAKLKSKPVAKPKPVDDEGEEGEEAPAATDEAKPAATDEAKPAATDEAKKVDDEADDEPVKAS